MATDLISQRAYARRRGVSHTAVQRAIKSGRLARAVHYRESGRLLGIDPELADLEWTEHTDPTKPTGPEAQAKPAPRPDGQGVLPGMPSPASDPPTSTPVQDAETIAARKRGVQAVSLKALFSAKLIEMQWKREAGKLADVEETKAGQFNIWRSVRNRLLAIPARVAAILAAETSEGVVFETLEHEIRETLSAVADELEESAAAEEDGGE